MNRFLLSAAVMSLSLALVGSATAADHGRGSHSPGSGSHFSGSTSHFSGSDFRSTGGDRMSHGTKFKGGYYFKGKENFHWSSRCWDRHYGCYTYYCPYTYCYYYWCEPDYCYYPITYCPYGKYCW
jgi:hypothetical protein